MAKTYNPKRYVISFGGHTLTGFADGTFVSVQKAADDFTKVVGADGEVARSASADESATVTLTLLQTSRSNDVLSAFRREDKLTNLGKKPLLIKDLNGTTVASAAEAWIARGPNIENAKEISPRVWVIDCSHLFEHIGGNF